MSLVVLDELIRSLISRKGEEQLTKQEAAYFAGFKSQVYRSCAIGASVATGLTWISTRKLPGFSRVALAGGASFLTIVWSLQKSVDSFVNDILGMDGSRMQYELKSIILEKFGNDPEKMKLFSKHFYCEEIFNDSNPGQPKSHFRQRNLYVDDQRTAGGSSPQESAKKVVHHQQRNDGSNVKLKSPTAETKQVPLMAGISVFGYVDPLDVLFNHSSTNEELHRPDESGKSAKVLSHREKRARRRHRLRHRHQETFSLGVAQFQGA